MIAEWLPVTAPLRAAILARADGERLCAAAAESGFRTLRDEATDLVARGETTDEEVRRVLGSA